MAGSKDAGTKPGMDRSVRMDGKRILRQAFLLVLAILLCGCASRDLPVDGTDVTVADRSETMDGRIRFLDEIRYSGAFVEDGSGDLVEGVAAILVQNTSEEYLQFSELVFQAGTKILSFTVTGLPPEACCWVLEQDAQQIPEGEDFLYVEDSSIYLPMLRMEEDLQVQIGSGSLTVRNGHDAAIHEAQVYYKQVNEDGHLFGGITYTWPVGDLAPGEEKVLTADHCDPGFVQVVWADGAKSPRP